MPAEGPLSVSEAAARLGVSPRRVRALISSGQLDARKAGGRWLIDPAPTELRRDRRGDRGRPLSTASAWYLLKLAASPGQLVDSVDHHLGSRRTRQRNRQRIGRNRVGELLGRLAPRLGTRGRLHRLRAHPSDVPRILQDSTIVRTGVSAAADYGADIVAPGVAEVYAPADRLPDLEAQYLLEHSGQPNVLLRAVEGPWPFPPGCRLAPITAVALDLLEADDERTRRAGRELLARLEASRP